MAQRRVTLAQVAEEAGVSSTTASFVLSGRTDMRISPDAQRRVREASDRLGYRPNLTARGLRTKVTHTFGLVSDIIASSGYAGEIIRGAVDEAATHQHMLFVGETQGDADLERQLVQELFDRQVDGLVYAVLGPRPCVPPETLRHRPAVLLQCIADGFDLPKVMPDDAQAGRESARALMVVGHREGVYAIGAHHRTEAHPAGIPAGLARMNGVEEVMAEHGTRLAGALQCTWEPAEGFAAVRSLLDSGVRPRALICANDRVAMGAYQALQEDGLRIPEDTSVVSVDNSDLATWLRPALSSVDLPYYEMGRLSVRLLAEPGDANGVHRVPMRMVARDSVAAPAG
ncbi:LacI family DNA-binding transcriptional regulator [Nocardiopsis sp. NRRL B-16309]|uniref:LacI family DNA-binding transcriptional regulator n=1 Tax=Nocardiopsis sp. NRRL B-16309 TaxID=1519494 RepID=UPI0006AF4A93|nr:LacI family DNA-binding transcriptional regulator [Nocardiopsis sp. NRRL B-16309]KOX12647.1 LacI family transcriptional regulator [Nocardiopsis sp. NRRL B-16309]